MLVNYNILKTSTTIDLGAYTKTRILLISEEKSNISGSIHTSVNLIIHKYLHVLKRTSNINFKQFSINLHLAFPDEILYHVQCAVFDES